MQDLIDKFEYIWIAEEARNSDLSARIQSVFPPEKIEFTRSSPSGSRELSAREFDRSKRRLLITPYKGKFFKRCPGSRPGLSCCNYFVLNWGLQCDMNCSYCYLQSFINTPMLTLYSNWQDALIELKEIGRELGGQTLRVGTGETVDSLSLDPLTLFSRPLIEFFRAFPRWTLEFKTKSDKVDQFLDVPHAGNVVVSWSVNPREIVEKEEHGTASLAARLAAAEKCRAKGFKLSFHLDPMIWHPHWRENYAQLVDEIAARFTPEQIPFMSVGALRFQPEQRAMMRERFGLNSYVTRAETFPGSDGKMRYPAHVREEMLQFVVSRFKVRDPRWRIFMCMETPETWLSVGGGSPFKQEHLKDLFDPEIIRQTERLGSDRNCSV